MAKAPEVNIKINVDDKATKQLDKAAKKVSTTNKNQAATTRKMATATDGASRATKVLTDSIGKQQGVLARNQGFVSFYLGQLKSLVPLSSEVSGGATLMSTALLSAFAGGGISALAGGVVGVIMTLKAVLTDAKTEAEKLRDMRLDNLKSQIEGSTKAVYDLEEALFKARGGDPVIRAMESQVDKLQGKYNEAAKNHKNWQAILDTSAISIEKLSKQIFAESGYEFQDEFQNILKTKRAYEEARSTLRIYIANKDNLKKAEEDNGKKIEESIVAINKNKTAEDARSKAIEAALATRITAEEKWRNEMMKSLDLVKGNTEAEEAILTEYARKSTEERRKAAEEKGKVDLAGLKSAENAANKEIEYEKKASANWQEIKKKDAQLTRDTQLKNEAMLASMSSLTASTLQGMMTGQLTYEKVVSSVWQTITSTIANAFTKILIKGLAHALAEIGLNAAIGASKAAAGASFGGPFTAIPMGAATYSAISGTYGALAMGAIAAERGGVVPGDVREQLAVLHPNETVLPADIAVPMRKQLKQGTNNITVNISAVDGESVKRLVSSRDFSRALSNAARNGRL